MVEEAVGSERRLRRRPHLAELGREARLPRRIGRSGLARCDAAGSIRHLRSALSLHALAVLLAGVNHVRDRAARTASCDAVGQGFQLGTRRRAPLARLVGIGALVTQAAAILLNAGSTFVIGEASLDLLEAAGLARLGANRTIGWRGGLPRLALGERAARRVEIGVQLRLLDAEDRVAARYCLTRERQQRGAQQASVPTHMLADFTCLAALRTVFRG